jgi:nitrite reductase/ring-hydroxylating ferredoxin subunit/uncharacterized membrane protein
VTLEQSSRGAVAPFNAIPRLEELSVLDPIIEAGVRAVQTIVPREVRDILHGVPGGHPLHPVLVQVPIGAWTSAAILDLIPGSRRSAGILVATGIVAAAPAAAAGLVDWSAAHHQQRRVGVVHAASNIVAVSLYSASLLARLRGRRLRGRALAYLGLAAVSVGGTLGGHLAYRQATGANHAEAIPHLVPEGWHDVGSINDLVDGKPAQLQLGTVPLVAVRNGATAYVLSGRCAHLSGPLHEGEVGNEDGAASLTCPWHGSVFRLRDGEVVHGPATSPQPSFETRIDDGGRLLVRLPGADG